MNIIGAKFTYFLLFNLNLKIIIDIFSVIGFAILFTICNFQKKRSKGINKLRIMKTNFLVINL